jgi:hypothetical protein
MILNNTLYIFIKKGEYKYLFVKYRKKIKKFNSGDIIIDWVDYIEFMLNFDDIEVAIDQRVYDYLSKNDYNFIILDENSRKNYNIKYKNAQLGFIVNTTIRTPSELIFYLNTKKRKEKILSLFNDIR